MKIQPRSVPRPHATRADARPPSIPPGGRWSAPVTVALVLAMATAAALPMPAGAATAWRCGNAYADKPCPDGRRVDVDDARSEQDRRAADESTRRAATRADAMERERLRTERAAAAHNKAVILADPRVAEAQAREAARRAAERSARLSQRSLNRTGSSRSRQQAAIGNGFVSQAQSVKR